MSATKTADIRQMTNEELEAAERRLREELFKLRFQKNTAQLSNTAQVGRARRELARVLTVQRERVTADQK